MDFRARGDRGAREAAGVTERMQIAAARIEHGADVAIRAGHLAQLLAVQIRHRHAAADALLRGLLDRGGAGLVIGRAQRAVLPRLARDLVAADQIMREVRGAVGELDHAAAELGAEIGLDLIGIVLQAGIDLAAIVARRAPARLLRLQHQRLDALLGQMQRRGQARCSRRRRSRRRRSCPHRAAAWPPARRRCRHRARAAEAGASFMTRSGQSGCSTRRRKSCVRGCCGLVEQRFRPAPARR